MVGPAYEPPANPEEGNWFGGAPEEAHSRPAPIVTQWWKTFDAPLLHDLLVQAEQENLSVRIAARHIIKARGILEAAESGFYPAVSAQASYDRMRRSANSEFGQFPGIDLKRETWQTGFDASWEVDLFGRVRRQLEAGEAILQATVYGRLDTLVSVQAETARVYMELRAAQALIDIIDRQAKLQKETARLIEQQVEYGQASEALLVRSMALTMRTRSRLPQARARAKAAVYALSVLVGKSFDELAPLLNTRVPLPVLQDPVKIGLRSDLLRRRPDIRQAERRLAARNAELGAAIANLFPSVSLTGSLGFESLQFDTLFDGASRTWLVNPVINIPIFNQGKIRAQIAIAEADRQIAFLDYEKTVKRALREAQDALTWYAENLDSLAWRKKALAYTEKRTGLALLRFEAGEDSRLDLHDAQQQLLQSRQAVIESHLAALKSLIGLYKSLGGGWLNGQSD